VVGKDDVGVLGDGETPAHVDALPEQGGDLAQQDPGVDDHAVADEALLALVQDARRQQVEDEGIPPGDDRVSRVVAALKTHDVPDVLGQDVDHLAFSLIPPL